jgi:DNA (cytosine-5)-methyltransferase 1
MSIKFIEVFSGCGGLSTGLIHAGLEPMLLVDNNKDCVETLKLNHGQNLAKLADVTKLHLDEYKNNCHVLLGGIPCQAFSQAGKRKGLDDVRGSLFFDFARLIGECQPLMFVVENVHGLLTLNKGETFQQVMNMLNVDGKYNIKYQLLNATDYEVPQKRKRVIIVGTMQGLHDFEFPKPIEHKIVLRDVLTDCPQSEGAQYPEHKRKVMELIPEGGCWVDLPLDIQKEYMGKSFESGGGKRGMARRLSMNEASLTLTTSPSQKQTERCHPLETRPLNIREYARIQTFPDDYTFHGSMASKYRQIGNAVPVKLAFHFGIAIKNYFEVLDSE